MKKILVVSVAIIMLCCSVFGAGAARELGEIMVDPWPYDVVMYPLFPFEDNTATTEYKQEFDLLINEEAQKIRFFSELYEYMDLDPSKANYYYDELYYYKASQDEDALSSDIDFVLVECMLDFYSLEHTYEMFGDYVVADYYVTYPYELGYYILIPETSEILTLKEAWDKKLEGINSIFENGVLGELIGDADKDGKLTVRDATAIQKVIAGISTVKDDKYTVIIGYTETVSNDMPITENKYISDYNRDGERNVKDATAIQKYIAGIKA